MIFPDLDITKQALSKAASVLQRDFRCIDQQKNSLDREKSLVTLKTKVARDFEQEITLLTKRPISSTNGWFFKALDGEVNFLSGIPVFTSYCTLIENSKVRGFGLTYPSKQEIYLCWPGLKLNLFKFNDEGLKKVSNTPSKPRIVSNIPSVGTNIGCNSLAYLYTAAGHFDGFALEMDDIEASAAEMIMTEACGKVSRIGKYIIGSNESVHEEIRQKVLQNLDI